MTTNTLSRSLHDVGLATWFGGNLANAVALNTSAGEASDPHSAGRVVNRGWDRWTPVNAVAIGAHLIGSVGQLSANRGRLTSQEGVATMAVAKTVLTAAALGATGYSRLLGKRVSKYDSLPVESGTTPHANTPDDAAQAQKQLSVLQWVIPAVTGALVVLSAYAGEQQRATEVHKGVAARLLG